jgi:N-alpha-acetyltransferase 15/16, NatA auxiliary subunit
MHGAGGRRLLMDNPDNYRYHEGLRAAAGLEQLPRGLWTQEQRKQLEAVYVDQQLLFPNSSAPFRIPLDFLVRRCGGNSGPAFVRCRGVWGACWHCHHADSSLPPAWVREMQEGEAFAAAADAYVRRFLERGIPSLFTDLKPLYQDAAKAAALGELFERLAAALSDTGRLPELGDAAAAQASQEGQPEAASEWAEQPGGEDVLLWTWIYLVQHYDRVGRTG